MFNPGKRHVLSAMAAATLWGCAGAALAQAPAEDQAGTIGSSRILESLNRDVVLDRPAASGRPPAGAVRPPSIDLSVQFAFDSAELLPQGRRQLDELGRALNHRSLSLWGFELAGHTDAVGAAEYNLKLSLERATAVKQYLVVQHGLNPERLVPLGFGFSRPALPADPRAAANRRVEVRRVALAGGRAVSQGQASTPSPGGHATGTPGAPAPLGGRLVPTP